MHGLSEVRALEDMCIDATEDEVEYSHTCNSYWLQVAEAHAQFEAETERTPAVQQDTKKERQRERRNGRRRKGAMKECKERMQGGRKR